MDALIMSCGTGGGHNSAAAAIAERLRHEGHSVTVLNPYDLVSVKLSKRIDRLYINIAQRAPKLFGAIYGLGDLYRRLPVHSPVYYFNGRMAEAMEAYLRERRFDIVIMTHIYPAEILTYMRDHGMETPKSVLIATDYTCIPFMEECVCDAYVIPSKKLEEEFTGRGLPGERVYPLGIPVSAGFSGGLSREKAREQLGLDREKRYILISGGSIGASKLKETVKRLQKITAGTNVKLIVICGSNTALRRRLEKCCGDETHIIGSTDQMALYLRSCDLFITKPGGLSTTEAAAMGVPLALMPPIPGCESHNARFFRENGMSLALDEIVTNREALLALLDRRASAGMMTERQHRNVNAMAARDICGLCGALADTKKQLKESS